MWGVGSHLGGLPEILGATWTETGGFARHAGWCSVAALLLAAYSLGGGTYTGIEAVSNGVVMLREPRVRTGKRTMALMATSLAFTAGGIMFGYLLTDSHPAAGRTMNSVLLSNLFGRFSFGTAFVSTSLIAEAALLFVAAQAGLLGKRLA